MNIVHPSSMANVEAFRGNFSSSTNLIFLKSVVVPLRGGVSVGSLREKGVKNNNIFRNSRESHKI